MRNEISRMKEKGLHTKNDGIKALTQCSRNVNIHATALSLQDTRNTRPLWYLRNSQRSQVFRRYEWDTTPLPLVTRDDVETLLCPITGLNSLTSRSFGPIFFFLSTLPFCVNEIGYVRNCRQAKPAVLALAETIIYRILNYD